MKTLITLASVAAVLAMSGCAAPNNGPKFLGAANNAEASTRIAVLDSVRYGTQAADTNGTWQQYAGQVAGAVLGGLAANQVKSNTFRPLATAGGAIGGAYVGQKIQASAGQVPAVELTYTYEGCKNDCTKTLVQRLEGDTVQAWKVGSRVRVTVGGGTGTRVIPL